MRLLQLAGITSNGLNAMPLRHYRCRVLNTSKEDFSLPLNDSHASFFVGIHENISHKMGFTNRTREKSRKRNIIMKASPPSSIDSSIIVG